MAYLRDEARRKFAFEVDRVFGHFSKHDKEQFVSSAIDLIDCIVNEALSDLADRLEEKTGVRP
jgi:hypothetical protein